MRNIIIVGRNESVVRIVFDSKTKNAVSTEFEAVVNGEVTGSTRINALAVVVRTLEQLKEKGISEEKEPVAFYTLGMVVDMINNGTFKYWAKNDNKKQDGEAVDATETKLWERFVELYKELYMDVVFKDVASVVIPQRPKFPVKNETRILHGFIEQAWEKVKVVAPELKDADGDAF